MSASKSSEKSVEMSGSEMADGNLDDADHADEAGANRPGEGAVAK